MCPLNVAATWLHNLNQTVKFTGLRLGQSRGFASMNCVCFTAKQKQKNKVGHAFRQLGSHGLLYLQGLQPTLTWSEHQTSLHKAHKPGLAPWRIGNNKETRLLGFDDHFQFKKQSVLNTPNNRINWRLEILHCKPQTLTASVKKKVSTFINCFKPFVTLMLLFQLQCWETMMRNRSLFHNSNFLSTEVDTFGSCCASCTIRFSVLLFFFSSVLYCIQRY